MTAEPAAAGQAYRESGVDIDAQDRALATVKELVRSTVVPGVLSELGGFGGLFALGSEYREPVLVASADGVGTKLMVAKMAGDYSTVGRDLVNHCVNDILVQGARPLFFLDYVGAGVLAPEHVVALVEGVAAGCRENGCALLGGETAEMPGFYQPGDYELVGFIVGVVERERVLGPARVRVGDVLLGLASEGLHTNGYSLARRVLFDTLGLGLADPLPAPTGGTSEEPTTVGAALLAPHASYLAQLRGLLDHPGLHAMAHVTGGGLTDNVPRSLPAGCRARIDAGAWEWPALFQVLAEGGGVGVDEMRRVFNLGIGMVLVVAPESRDEVLAHLAAHGQYALQIGEVVAGAPGVEYVEN
ncbi:MAG TPA: phosphoribosylformylglycinamidine cyclo-ligase [Thermoanaerobaculia bacterium]|nr:phosphoribosylformylglycinamidine cyclo-ligase [Thermoanaerobaculia bacterium]